MYKRTTYVGTLILIKPKKTNLTLHTGFFSFISFCKPKKDSCDQCTRYELASPDEKLGIRPRKRGILLI